MSKQEDFHRPEKPLQKTREIDNKARISEKAEMKRKFNKNQQHITPWDIHPVKLSNLFETFRYSHYSVLFHFFFIGRNQIQTCLVLVFFASPNYFPTYLAGILINSLLIFHNCKYISNNFKFQSCFISDEKLLFLSDWNRAQSENQTVCIRTLTRLAKLSESLNYVVIT